MQALRLIGNTHPRIAILSPSVTTGDAVSNDVLGMYMALTNRGIEARIFAEGGSLPGVRVWPASKIKSFLKKPADILIYHYARGWASGLDLIRSLGCRTVIKYHNVTPPEFFLRYNADLARLCADGREQLVPLARAGCDLYLSASAYNLRELLTEGVAPSRSFVVPPFHHIDRLHEIEPDLTTLDRWRDGVTNILMVGRVVPNKGHPALIEAFAAYHYDYNPNSRLIIVGREDKAFHAYSARLRELIRFYAVEDAVVFAGEISDSALKAYYLIGRAFAFASEHEGFCVPLVEAMAMKVPIIAYASSAIPDTVGEAGLVWKERDPYLMAESVNTIVTDHIVRVALCAMGQKRYEQNFTNERIKIEFFRALDRLL